MMPVPKGSSGLKLGDIQVAFSDYYTWSVFVKHCQDIDYVIKVQLMDRMSKTTQLELRTAYEDFKDKKRNPLIVQ